MRWRSYQYWVLAVVVPCGMTGAVKAQQRDQRNQSDASSHLRPQHREAVEQWLVSRKLASLRSLRSAGKAEFPLHRTGIKNSPYSKANTMSR